MSLHPLQHPRPMVKFNYDLACGDHHEYVGPHVSKSITTVQVKIPNDAQLCLCACAVQEGFIHL